MCLNWKSEWSREGERKMYKDGKTKKDRERNGEMEKEESKDKTRTTWRS